MTEPRDLVGSTEAARILGTTERTVQRKANTGAIPIAAKIPGRTGAYLFERADVEAIAHAGTGAA